MEVILGYPMWLVCVFVVGACIGSFLNVVIYRIPLGLSVNQPRRSFCPSCKKEIPLYRNIPILTWFLQRGKCAECGAPFSFRYALVEILTASLLTAGWYIFVTSRTPAAPMAALLVGILVILLVTISFIDAEHMIIPVLFCYVGMVIGVLGNTIDPTLVTLVSRAGGGEMEWWRGGAEALVGLAAGWGVLAAVVILGKFLLGQKRVTFDEAEEWYLRDPQSDDEELSFVLGEEQIGWSELFYRKSDCLEIEGDTIVLDGTPVDTTGVKIERELVRIGDEEYSIEKLKSLSGRAERVVIPREAMGSGDPPLLGMIGAFLGWKGVLLGLFASCMYAILAAILGRIGFGRELPFGPFQALGALTWIFGGWMLWEWYFATLGGLMLNERIP